MSFILDALKKAERERDLARVPTLSTVHIPVLTTGRRFGLWVAAGVFLVGGGLSIWLWRPSPPVAPPTGTNSRAQAGTTLPASPADSALTPPPARAVETAPLTSVAPVPSRPAAAEQRNEPPQPSPEPATTPRSIQALPGQPSGSGLVAASSGQPRGGGGRSTGNPFRSFPPDPTRPTGATPPEPVPVQPVPPQPVPVQPVPVITVPAPSPPARPQAAPSPGVVRPPAAVVAPSPPAQPAPPTTLVDALAKMRLDLFVYTDVPADRMVVINGRKYGEGEEVDGLYRVESITREGALLSYKDEKLLLRP